MRSNRKKLWFFFLVSLFGMHANHSLFQCIWIERTMWQCSVNWRFFSSACFNMWFFFAWNSLISRSLCTVSIAFVAFFSNSNDCISFFLLILCHSFCGLLLLRLFRSFCYALIRNICLFFLMAILTLLGSFYARFFFLLRHNFFSGFASCLTEFVVCYINLVVVLMSSFHSNETQTRLFSVCSHASFCINSSSTCFTCKSFSVATLLLLWLGLCFWVIVFNRF